MQHDNRHLEGKFLKRFEIFFGEGFDDYGRGVFRPELIQRLFKGIPLRLVAEAGMNFFRDFAIPSFDLILALGVGISVRRLRFRFILRRGGFKGWG